MGPRWGPALALAVVVLVSGCFAGQPGTQHPAAGKTGVAASFEAHADLTLRGAMQGQAKGQLHVALASHGLLVAQVKADGATQYIEAAAFTVDGAASGLGLRAAHSTPTMAALEPRTGLGRGPQAYPEQVEGTWSGTVTPVGDAHVLGEDAPFTGAAPLVAFHTRLPDLDDAIVVETGQATVTGERIVVGGDIPAGAVHAEFPGAGGALHMVVAHGATFTLGPDLVKAGSLRVTQALDGSGYLVRAAIELTGPPTVHVQAHNATSVRVGMRETTGVGDAVLGSVAVTGDGAAMVYVPVQDPAQEVLATLDDLPAPMAAVAAVPVAFGAFGMALAQGLCGIASAFSGEDCPVNYPCPSYFEAGGGDRFYVFIQAGEPGEYDAVLHLTGRNYDDATLPLHIVVDGS